MQPLTLVQNENSNFAKVAGSSLTGKSLLDNEGMTLTSRV